MKNSRFRRYFAFGVSVCAIFSLPLASVLNKNLIFFFVSVCCAMPMKFVCIGCSRRVFAFPPSLLLIRVCAVSFMLRHFCGSVVVVSSFCHKILFASTKLQILACALRRLHSPNSNFKHIRTQTWSVDSVWPLLSSFCTNGFIYGRVS